MWPGEYADEPESDPDRDWPEDFGTWPGSPDMDMHDDEETDDEKEE